MTTSKNDEQSPANRPIRLLIASPVRQSPAILALFLHGLLLLHADGIEVAYRFIDDNDDDRSSRLLQQFAHAVGPAAAILQSSAPAEAAESYVRTEHTHQWSESLIWKVASFKNSLISHARDAQYDYLLLVDSDLVLHPDTLHRLVAADRPIVSEIFWTRWQPEAAAQPQVWMRDEYAQWEQQRGEKLTEEEQAQRYAAFINKLRRPGLYEVGGLGALTLINQAAMAGNVHFGPISNLSFWGEDRHFCVRAAALGFPLFVDTHCPAFHIYRQTDQESAEAFLHEHAAPIDQLPPKAQAFAAIAADWSLRPSNPSTASPSSIVLQELPKLTLSMTVRNESKRYLRQVLASHRRYIDEAVIIDDASEDDTAAICLQELEGIPVRLIRNARSKFGNEIELRKQQWTETAAASPDWILCLDADEQFEERFVSEVRSLLTRQDTDMYCFRLYDLWDASHYREDFYWRAHETYRPFLLRYRPDFAYEWQETPQHCGRLPMNIFQLPHQISQLRLKHYGWSNAQDRRVKYERYMRLDPDGQYGWKEQYESILDAQPRLIRWEE
ncbi:glycosyl transferase family 2 [Paenibacillus curdlanolyticus YK9]|uniref:Glycosyl transferase family 2 n=1 Tax=Paenibacillus curdlanolyticus YK9 TaxID=717606 RepID=E0IGH0_9BACL|nr:glycosyltransferase [Paenibacillus curdlanolyticus]EFM08410.1 glycosyl transferase family 2 [Paenibacillus curdlanolyticus YK9]